MMLNRYHLLANNLETTQNRTSTATEVFKPGNTFFKLEEYIRVFMRKTARTLLFSSLKGKQLAEQTYTIWF